MKSSVLKSVVSGLAATSVLLGSTAVASAQFADSVVDYTPGAGHAAGFTDPASALGAPTMLLSYGPVDQFNPPFSTNDLVSIGVGGWLTLQFDTPIENQPDGATWGMDFVVFGNEGFMDTNWPAGMTDGQLFNQVFGTPGMSRVWVSENGTDYFELQVPPSISATVDNLFPPDSAGTIGVPVNPYLSNDDFAGLDLAGIRGLYNGSAGGAAFDLDWAIDDGGQPVALSQANYIQIEVTDSKVEVDAISVVPEPTTLSLSALVSLVILVKSRRRRANA